MSSQPHIECASCSNPCAYKLDAERFLHADPPFTNAIIDALSEGDIDGVVDQLLEKSQEVLETRKVDDVIGLGFCFYVVIVQELELPAELRKKMARTIRMKMQRNRDEIKKAASLTTKIKRGIEKVGTAIEDAGKMVADTGRKVADAGKKLAIAVKKEGRASVAATKADPLAKIHYSLLGFVTEDIKDLFEPDEKIYVDFSSKVKVGDSFLKKLGGALLAQIGADLFGDLAGSLDGIAKFVAKGAADLLQYKSRTALLHKPQDLQVVAGTEALDKLKKLALWYFGNNHIVYRSAKDVFMIPYDYVDQVEMEYVIPEKTGKPGPTKLIGHLKFRDGKKKQKLDFLVPSGPFPIQGLDKVGRRNTQYWDMYFRAKLATDLETLLRVKAPDAKFKSNIDKARGPANNSILELAKRFLKKDYALHAIVLASLGLDWISDQPKKDKLRKKLTELIGEAQDPVFEWLEQVTGKKRAQLLAEAKKARDNKVLLDYCKQIAKLAERSPKWEDVQVTADDFYTLLDTEGSAQEAIEGKPTSASGKIAQWIQEDKDAMRDVKRVQVMGDNQVRVLFDPATEGYISQVDIQLIAYQMQGEALIQGIFKTKLGIRYIYDIAIGTGRKKMVAVSLPGTTEATEKYILQELATVDKKDQISWDKAMIALNNDKKLLKWVGKLELKSPFPEKLPHIRVPVKIMKEPDGFTIYLQTFLHPKMKPAMILYGILDRIGEDLDFLGGLDASDQAERLQPERLFSVSQPTQKNFTFKYLQKDAQVDVKVCPNCHRPLAPDADYRRCPHCLYKLK